MQTAYVIEGEMIDNQTIKINELLNLENKKILVTIQPIEDNVSINMEKLGNKYDGKIWISPDFNDPLEDFKEYME